MKFSLGQENTFCVSLDSRWPAMQERLERLGIPCTRWKASLPDQTYECFAPHLNKFQRACAQSHVCLWREMLRRNLPYAFIMEDDVLFSHDWREILESFDRVDDEAWDLVLLNASEALSPEDTWLPCTHQWLTGAYILSRKGAKWLLANFREKKWEADCMTWCLQDQGHSYAYFPWPVIQEGIDSTIGSDVQANRAKVLSLLGERVSSYS
jgi:GR25 family glycosyltransferase involved in LPS biosynthesis